MSTFDECLLAFRESLEGDFVPAVEAGRFVEMMEQDHPDELAEWMRSNAVYFVTRSLGDLLRKERGSATRNAASRAFAAAAESGETDRLSLFQRVVFKVDDNNTRRPLGEMTGADHLYVASHYEDSANRVKLKAAFHRAVAKKVGKKRTDEVLDVEQYQSLLDSFLRPPGAQAA